MLKTRIIPTLLWKETTLVKGAGFNSWRRVGSLLPAIKVYNLREVDELLLFDISATGNGTEPDYDTIADVAKACSVPFTVGGGVRDLKHIHGLLRAGADKVCINSYAYEDLGFISRAAEVYGSQCIMVAIDARFENGQYQCYSHNGTVATGLSPAEWAKKVEAAGAGELVVTSIERDGTMEGYDLELIKSVTDTVSIPVIASGGAGSYQDFLDALRQGGANAVAAASIYHFTEQTPLEAKAFLAKHGIPVRR